MCDPDRPTSVPPVPDTPSSLRLVRRDRLFELLRRGTGKAVTVVSGPAGSGKTLLVASWLRDEPWPGEVEWISVEGQARPAAAFARLSERLDELDAPVLLVVDEVQDLEAPEAMEALAVLLAASPPLRVVLITRRYPDLGLHRLRAAGELTEIRAADLEFTAAEVGELLARAGIEVSDESVAELRERTEGWATGLRLATLALGERADPDRFVAEFSGSERTVSDYLVGEVLARQSPEVRRLLLRTSVLDRVNGPLARLLGGAPEAEAELRRLEEGNAFVRAVDLERSWFRYHRLLADLLRAELRRQAPDELESLHRAAARWYGEHDFPVEAIGHAQSAGDWEYAGQLLGEHWVSLFVDGEQPTIRRLLTGFPKELLRSEPRLATLMAADRLGAGTTGAADAWLSLAEQLWRPVPKGQRGRFEVVLAIVKLMHARTRGQLEAAAESAQAILTLADGDAWPELAANEEVLALALMNLGFVEQWALRLDDADRHLDEGLALARRIERPYLTLGCLAIGAEVAIMRNRPERSEARSREAIELAERFGWSDDPMVGVAYSALAGVFFVRGQLPEGERWLERAEEVLGGPGDPAAGLILLFRRGWLAFTQSRYADAAECFVAVEHASERLLAPHFLSRLASVWQLRVAIALGNSAPARAALAADRNPPNSQAQWAILEALLLLSEDDPRGAVKALRRIRDGSAAIPHVTFEIEAYVLEAVARDRLGQPPAVERLLERALDLAAPGGHVWIVFTVPAVTSLLQRHPRHRTAHGAFIAELLDRYAAAQNGRHAPPAGELRDRLTERELTVLGLLPTNLSAAEIGGELFISVHTVKMHTRNIYAKLGVNRRSEAVERARALGLLNPANR